jgi:hypothetical protein
VSGDKPSYRLRPKTAATVSALSAAFGAMLAAVAAVSGLLFWIQTTITHSFAEGEAARRADQDKFEAARRADQDKLEATRRADQDKLEAARRADQERMEKKTRRLMFAMQRPKHASDIIHDMRDIEVILCDAKYQK